MSEVIRRVRLNDSGCPDCGVPYGHTAECPRAATSKLPIVPKLGTCSKCGVNRFEAACPNGHAAEIVGLCPMVGMARTIAAARQMGKTNMLRAIVDHKHPEGATVADGKTEEAE